MLEFLLLLYSSRQKACYTYVCVCGRQQTTQINGTTRRVKLVSYNALQIELLGLNYIYTHTVTQWCTPFCSSHTHASTRQKRLPGESNLWWPFSLCEATAKLLRSTTRQLSCFFMPQVNIFHVCEFCDVRSKVLKITREQSEAKPDKKVSLARRLEGKFFFKISFDQFTSFLIFRSFVFRTFDR